MSPRRTELVDRNADLMEQFRFDPLTPYSELAARFGMKTERVRFLITQRMRKVDQTWKKQSRSGHGTLAHTTCKACSTLFIPTRSRDAYCADHKGKGYVKGIIPRIVKRRCLICSKPFNYAYQKLMRTKGRAGVYCSNSCRYHALKINPLRNRSKK